jgi:hypothetical protein
LFFSDSETFAEALKSHSHLLKLSIAHALAQSTLLSYYESQTNAVLSSPQTLSIPTQLATKGALTLRRHEALRLTGKLFKLRRDVNLVRGIPYAVGLEFFTGSFVCVGEQPAGHTGALLERG